MLRHRTPAAVAPPRANYSHAVEVPAGAGLLVVSGQLGLCPDGSLPAAFEDEAEACFQNVGTILGDAGLTFADVVRLNTYLTDAAWLEAYMTVRDRHVADPPPASTLLVVQALARPEFRIEIEVIAARA
jgi:enamine deaminase RidA (YjgF/YER057c/UK114 family)